MTTLLRGHENSAGGPTALPLVVELDGTLFKVDMLYERVVLGLSAKLVPTMLSLLALKNGTGAFKARLFETADPDFEMLPVRDEFLAFLRHESAQSREIYFAPTTDQKVAASVVARFPIFRTLAVEDKKQQVDFAAAAKAIRLQELFPDGFVYAGDGSADLAIWKNAKAAIIVSGSRSLSAAVRSAGVPIERIFDTSPTQVSRWIAAIRPQHWVKNTVVLVPVVLGWRDVTIASAATAFVMTVLLCAVASLTYLVNDMLDLASDRRHWSKRRRPFASGEIAVRDGLIVVGFALPLLCGLGLWISPSAGICLISYVVMTLGYSFGWKRIPLFDAFIIALLFTIRVLIGIAAAKLAPSAWLLTFSMFFFFALALAKRHTEILRSAKHDIERLEGRGYQLGDQSLTLTFGVGASMASIVIVVIYLVEEVFARQIYHTPAWLWTAPIAICLFICRIWVLSHRGKMTDDPVVFALRDRVSLVLGFVVAVGILLAL